MMIVRSNGASCSTRSGGTAVAAVRRTRSGSSGRSVTTSVSCMTWPKRSPTQRDRDLGSVAGVKYRCPGAHVAATGLTIDHVEDLDLVLSRVPQAIPMLDLTPGTGDHGAEVVLPILFDN